MAYKPNIRATLQAGLRGDTVLHINEQYTLMDGTLLHICYISKTCYNGFHKLLFINDSII